MAVAVQSSPVSRQSIKSRNCLSVINVRAEIDFVPELAGLGQIAPMLSLLQGR